MPKIKHGGWRENRKLYQVWSCMLSRCNNQNNTLYKNYGGRGISVCDEWKNFSAFREWALKAGYQEGNNKVICSIERINVNGNYDPLNCKWATAKEQQNNTRRNVRLTYNDETKTLAQWAGVFGIRYSTFMSRYRRGWSIERIATTPVQIYGKGMR